MITKEQEIKKLKNKLAIFKLSKDETNIKKTQEKLKKLSK